MIFDFKSKLNLKSWDKSNLELHNPKLLKDYLNEYKSHLKNNLILFIPFVSLFSIVGSLHFYSSRLQNVLLRYEDSHYQYQENRSLIIDSKRDLRANEQLISSLNPFISDSIYPNLFLSLMSPIMPIDSSIIDLSLSKDSSSIRINSLSANVLSDIYSTLDQHPLVKNTDISFTSIKGPSDSQSVGSGVPSASNQIEINFSYDFIDTPDLIKLFELSESNSLTSKANLLK